MLGDVLQTEVFTRDGANFPILPDLWVVSHQLAFECLREDVFHRQIFVAIQQNAPFQVIFLFTVEWLDIGDAGIKVDFERLSVLHVGRLVSQDVISMLRNGLLGLGGALGRKRRHRLLCLLRYDLQAFRLQCFVCRVY